jgi:hypothetical protein
MKVSPKADYPIQVILESEEQDGPDAHHFDGIYWMVLNHTVHVAFVPDLSGLAPPWDYRQLPPTIDEVTSPQQARLLTAFHARYMVTPNEPLAGTEERFEGRGTGGAEARTGVVFYTTGAEFQRFQAGLADLSEIVFSPWPDETVSDLRRFEVVTFLERRVVGSAWLRPPDAAMLGRSPHPQ